MNLVWASAADFLAMGGYGFYVWGSFGMTALAIAAEIWTLNQVCRDLRSTPDPEDDQPTPNTQE